MRNPRRFRNIAIFVTLLGLAMLPQPFLIADDGGSEILQDGLFIAGLTCAILGAPAALVGHTILRGQERLRRGEGVLARWRVDPVRWRRFMASEAAGGGSAAGLRNDLSLRREAPSEGIEVVIGRDAVQVDGEFHRTRPGGAPGLVGLYRLPGPPPALEFHLYYPPTGRGGGSREAALRFPVGLAAEAEAERVIQHYAPAIEARLRKRSLAMRRPRLTQGIALAVALLCGLSFAAGMLLRERQDLAELPLLLAVVGAVLGLGALLLAAIVQLLLRAGAPRGPAA